MSEGGQGRGTRARLRRGNVQVQGQVPVVEPLEAVRCGSGEKGLTEGGLRLENVKAVRQTRARWGIVLPQRHVRQRIRDGHRGPGGACNRGRSRRGRGAHILDLPKQGVLHILRLRQKAELSVLTGPKGHLDILGRNTEGLRPAAGSKPARGDPVPPVQREPAALSTNMRGRGGGNNGGSGGRGRGSGRQRAFDPQHRGRARRPWPRGSHGDHCVIGWGRGNPGRIRSLHKSHIKSITCRLLRRGVPIPRHEARAQGTGWVRL